MSFDPAPALPPLPTHTRYTGDPAALTAFADQVRALLAAMRETPDANHEAASKAVADAAVALQAQDACAILVACGKCGAQYPLVVESGAVTRTLYKLACAGCGRTRTLDEVRKRRVWRAAHQRMYGR